MESSDTTFRRPRENGDLVNRLATLIKALNKVSHVPGRALILASVVPVKTGTS